MPFAPALNPVFDLLILPAIQAAHFEAIRTDRLAVTGDLTAFLRQEILRASCAIAVISGSNPNVYYELGLVHAANKPAILLKQSPDTDGDDEVPFDIRNHRLIPYPVNLESSGARVAIEEIHATLRQVASRRSRFAGERG